MGKCEGGRNKEKLLGKHSTDENLPMRFDASSKSEVRKVIKKGEKCKGRGNDCWTEAKRLEGN